MTKPGGGPTTNESVPSGKLPPREPPFDQWEGRDPNYKKRLAFVTLAVLGVLVMLGGVAVFAGRTSGGQCPSIFPQAATALTAKIALIKVLDAELSLGPARIHDLTEKGQTAGQLLGMCCELAMRGRLSGEELMVCMAISQDLQSMQLALDEAISDHESGALSDHDLGSLVIGFGARLDGNIARGRSATTSDDGVKIVLAPPTDALPKEKETEKPPAVSAPPPVVAAPKPPRKMPIVVRPRTPERELAAPASDGEPRALGAPGQPILVP